MNDIPDFAEALAQFRRFLAEQRNPGEVFWVFREDVWRLSPTEVRIKYPPSAENVRLARKVFAEGRARGLVEINAIATASEKVAVTVWFPKDPNEEFQGWAEGMKFSILQPIPSAELVDELRWSQLGDLPQFRHYQRAETFIGTKAWAAA